MDIHPDITLDRVLAAHERWFSTLSDPGFCVACGAEVETGCEPDMTQGECERCGEPKVHGADELLLQMTA